MVKELTQGIRFTLVTIVLLGGGYNLVIWGIGRVAFPAQAEGSLIRRSDGTVVGARLIAQKFTRPEYFQPRPSGVDYNAASTGVVMLLSRYIPIIAPLALAGYLAAKPASPETAGSLRADSATFGFTLWAVVVILGLLMFMPVAVLGPIAEHLALR